MWSCLPMKIQGIPMLKKLSILPAVAPRLYNVRACILLILPILYESVLYYAIKY